ncbi:MAG: alpha-ketoglutarate-dependent dioxygenase AlkB family protein [Candidatus Sericytochromatia bacterium]
MSPRSLPLTALPASDFERLPAWLSADAADALLARLLAEVPWQQGTIRLFGRTLPEPRLSAWYGDPEAAYRYAGRQLTPLPWLPELALLRAQLVSALKCPLNSVLLNLYRNGHDSMGLHSDDEPELGPEPVIASLSLGATRRFRVVPKQPGCASASGDLAHGDLFVMRGQSQQAWKHALPKQPHVTEARLNLTFRQIAPLDGRGK